MKLKGTNNFELCAKYDEFKFLRPYRNNLKQETALRIEAVSGIINPNKMFDQ